MKLCDDCRQPIRDASAWSSNRVCKACRGKRAGRVNREKAAKHGSDYFNGRDAHARSTAV